MIFTRIRMWGNLSNLGQWKKNPCVFLPCFIPTTFIKKCCWWLRQLWSLGVGWQDCQFSPTHTLHHSWLHSRRKFVPSHDKMKHSRTPLSCTTGFLSVHALSNFGTSRFCCSSPRMNHLLFVGLTHRYFPSFSNWCSELRVVLFYPWFTVLLWFSHA